ncbi:autotransporter domain-containing protein (plasmid) [Nitrobacteraceae bacterium UC4446_H13]
MKRNSRSLFRRKAVLLASTMLAGVYLANSARAAVITVASEAQLQNAISSSAQNGDTIKFAGNITLSRNLPYVLKSVIIDGSGFTLSGGGQTRGLMVLSGQVTINDLKISDTVAKGGNGGNGHNNGGGGGGGAGLGGGLFIGETAKVTVSNVQFQNNKAQGGNGGASADSAGLSAGGGGGGLLGNGGSARTNTRGAGGDGSPGNRGGNGAHAGDHGGAGLFGGGGGGGSSSRNGGAGGFGGGGAGGGSRDWTGFGPDGAGGVAGFGGGRGGSSYEWGSDRIRNGAPGGGGAGMGGAIFVQQGGQLAFAGTLDIGGNTVAGGSAATWRSQDQAFIDKYLWYPKEKGLLPQNGQAFGNGLFLHGNGSFTFKPGAGQIQTVRDVIADQTGVSGSGGSWSLVKDGVGTTILSGEQKYSGGITVKNGVLQGTASSLRGDIKNDASLVFTQNGNATFANAISGKGQLTYTGSGEFTLAGNNTYSGGTVVQNGTLRFSRAENLGASTSPVTLNNSIIGTISARSHPSVNNPLSLKGNGTIDVTDKSTMTWNGVIDGGHLIKTGTGELTLTGKNTYSGGTAVNGGTLRIVTDASLGKTGTPIALHNGTLGTTAVTGAPPSVPLEIGRNFKIIDNGGFDVALHPLTLSGVIAGNGKLIKRGAGTLVLRGENLHSGGTLVEKGTVQVSSDDNLGRAGAPLTLQGNGVLQVSSSFATGRPIAVSGPTHEVGGIFTIDAQKKLTLNNSISGAGAVIKNGLGVLALNGKSSYSGSTFVNQGELIVNGSIMGSPRVIVDGNTSVLSGNGEYQNVTTRNGGRIEPGNSIGVMQVRGDLTIERGSTYEIDIAPTGSSDHIYVDGKATLSGRVDVITEPGIYKPDTYYGMLSAQGGLDGTFSEITTNMRSAFLTPTLAYDSNGVTGLPGWSYVYLGIVQTANLSSVARTPNQIGAGAALEALGLGAQLYDGALMLSADEARAAFDALSGDTHASARTALVEESHFARDAANERLRQSFAAVGAVSLPVMSYAPDAGAESPASNAMAYAVPTKALPRHAYEPTSTLAIWGQGFGSWGHTASNGNAGRLGRSTGGVISGFDALVAETWRLGVMAGYSHTTFNAADRAASGRSNNYHIGVYGGTQFGALGIRTSAAYTWHDIAMSRSVAVEGFSDSSRMDYHAATTQAFGELGYRLDFNRLALEPFVNLAYVNFRSDGFTERGGPMALTIAGSNSDTTFTTLGARASTGFMLGNVSATARGTLGWRHAFGDVTPLARVAMAGSNAFSVAGVPIAREAAMIEAGLDLALSPSATIGISYNGQFGNNSSDQSVRGKFVWAF